MKTSILTVLACVIGFSGCGETERQAKQLETIEKVEKVGEQPTKELEEAQPTASVLPPTTTTHVIHGENIVQTFYGKVVGVTDGDTIKVLVTNGDSNEERRVRLAAIDAPKKRSGQAYAEKSREALAAMVFNRDICVFQIDVDRWGRIIGFVYVLGEDVGDAMVRAGLAWEFDRYSKSETLGLLEQQARASKVGLWADPDPIPPWEFRKKN